MSTPPARRLFISDLINRDAIQPALKGSRRDEVLAELVAGVPEFAGQPVARETLLRALIEREQLFSTGIGDGVALPHARKVLAGLVKKPLIVFGRHPQGIDYGSIDHHPARLFFLLVSTGDAEHLQILAHLSRLARTRTFRESLLAAPDAGAILKAIATAEGRA